LKAISQAIWLANDFALSFYRITRLAYLCFDSQFPSEPGLVNFQSTFVLKDNLCK